MKFLIAGFGSIGRRHMRNLLALGEKDLVFYRTHKSTLSEDETRGFPVETDLKAALDHKPDVVIVSNPTAYHLDVAIPAAEAGCDLLLEKPISNSMARLDELKSALALGGGKVLVGFQFRYHSGLQYIDGILRRNELGRPLSFRSQWGEYLPNWHPWEDYRKSYSARDDLGGGVVLTLSHPLDYIRWLFGDVESLWAYTGRLSDLEIRVEDVGEVGMCMRSGAIGSLHLDYYQQPAVHTLEIVCTHGKILWDNADGIVHVYTNSSADWCTHPVPEGFERNMLFLDEMRHMLVIAQENAEPVCTLEDGVRALELALAIHQSGRSHLIQYLQ